MAELQITSQSLSHSETKSHKHIFDKSHSSSLLKGLAKLRQDGAFCDINLQGKQYNIQAHRLVLAAFCPYFAALIHHDIKEGHQEKITLPDFLSGKTLNILINFAYTGELDIMEENVQDLLVAANFLGIMFVQNECCSFLADHLDVHNCAHVVMLAEQLGCTELAQNAKLFLGFHFSEVVTDEDFLHLSDDIISMILQLEAVFIEDAVGVMGTEESQEEAIYKALIRYVDHAPEKRSRLLSDLLQYVRLPLMTEAALDRVQAYCLKRADGTHPGLIKKAKQMKKRMTKEVVEDNWCQPRLPKTQLTYSNTFANLGHVRPEVGTFEKLYESRGSHFHVAGAKLWIRRWDGRPVLGGMAVYFNNDQVSAIGQTDCTDVHEFHLDPDERIIRVDLNHGWMIDKLTFHTSKNRQFGPYGGPGGGPGTTSPPLGVKYGNLVGVSGTLVKTQGSLAITRLKFIWMHYLSPIDKNVHPPQTVELSERPFLNRRRGPFFRGARGLPPALP